MAFSVVSRAIKVISMSTQLSEREEMYFFDGEFILSQIQTTCRSSIAKQSKKAKAYIHFIQVLGTQGHYITWSKIVTNVFQ